MASFYYVRRRGKVEGPISAEDAQKRVKTNQLARFDQISTDGKNWIKAGEDALLFPSVQPPREKQPIPREKSELGTVVNNYDMPTLTVDGFLSGDLPPDIEGEFQTEGDSDIDAPQVDADELNSKSARLAWASLLFAILGATFLPLLGCMVAVVCGHLSLPRLGQNRVVTGKLIVAIAGTVGGYVGFALWTILFIFLVLRRV